MPTAEFVKDRDHPEVLEEVEDRIRGTRYYRVVADRGSDALTANNLPARFSSWDETLPDLRLRSRRPVHHEGRTWFIELVYSTVSLTGGSGPGPVPGLKYSIAGHDNGTLTLDADINLEPINEGGAQVVARFPTVTVVHHRTTPPPTATMLGLGGGTAGRQRILGVVSDKDLFLPPYEWNQGSFVQGEFFRAGELLYLHTDTEYIPNGGLFICKHYLQAAPDHLHHWIEANPNTGARVEKSSQMYPVGAIESLWEG